MIYRAANEEVAAGAAAGSSSTASLAVAESAVSAALYATAGAAGAAMAADAVMEAVKTAASAKSASQDSKDDNDGSSSSSESTPKQLTLSPSPAAVRHFNRHNVVMKSFRNVALADLELVFPSKHVEVLPSTLVRSALTAVGAVVAAAALIQQQVGM